MCERPSLETAQTSRADRVPLRFDFNKAVADARRDFPAETANTTFVAIDAPGAEEQMQAFIDGLPEEDRSLISKFRENNPDAFTANQGARVWATASGKKLLTAFTGEHQPSAQELILFGTQDDAKQAYYTFEHELGHVVVKNADNPTNYSEHAADTFALLRGFQSGFLDKSDAQLIAKGRDTLMWYNADYKHVTSMSLDALVINPKQIDFISLTPAEIAAVAAKHAETFSLSSDLTALRWIQRATDIPIQWTSDYARLERLSYLADVLHRAPEESHATYTAARALQTAFELHEARHPAVKDMMLDHEDWKTAREDVCTRMKNRDLGAKRAMQKNPDIAPDPDKSQGAFNKLRNKLKPLKI